MIQICTYRIKNLFLFLVGGLLFFCFRKKYDVVWCLELQLEKNSGCIYFYLTLLKFQ